MCTTPSPFLVTHWFCLKRPLFEKKNVWLSVYWTVCTVCIQSISWIPIDHHAHQRCNLGCWIHSIFNWSKPQRQITFKWLVEHFFWSMSKLSSIIWVVCICDTCFKFSVSLFQENSNILPPHHCSAVHLISYFNYSSNFVVKQRKPI